MEIKKIKSINGNDFSDNVQDLDEISVLRPGYVIDLDGNCVPILEGEDHSAKLSQIYQKYADTKYEYLQDIPAAVKLTKLGFIVYIGARQKDMSNNGQSTEGMGLFFFPANVIITESQKNALDKLVSTNKSIFGNHDRMNIEHHTIEVIDFRTEFRDATIDDINNAFLENKTINDILDSKELEETVKSK